MAGSMPVGVTFFLLSTEYVVRMVHPNRLGLDHSIKIEGKIRWYVLLGG